MDRREFIKTTGTLLAATTLSGASGFGEEPGGTGRSILPINRNWRYHPAKVEGASAASFDDSSFERVVIPHPNIRLPWHNFDDKYYEFVSTYRGRFRLPQSAAGNPIFVDFERVLTPSTV